MWEHTHEFTEVNSGVMMKDKVRYSLPFGILGRIIHKLIVRKKVNEIFIFRKKILEKLYPGNKQTLKSWRS
jgi:ligand-binding SRPBCC domain-containing protein